MDPRFDDILHGAPRTASSRSFSFPDRIYHAQYLNATRSPRYRYNVMEVREPARHQRAEGRGLPGRQFLCNFLRIEYRAGRLVEQMRERGRFLRDELLAWVKLHPADEQDARGRLRQAALRPLDRRLPGRDLGNARAAADRTRTISSARHDGRGRLDHPRASPSSPALRRHHAHCNAVELAFRENDRDLPFGYQHSTIRAWDNDFTRSHQEPRTQEPSSSQNTDQRPELSARLPARLVSCTSTDVDPVRYRNAMMEAGNPGCAATTTSSRCDGCCSANSAARWSSSTK